MRELYKDTYSTIRRLYKKGAAIYASSGQPHIQAAVASLWGRDKEFTGWMDEAHHEQWLDGRYYRAIEAAESYEDDTEPEPNTEPDYADKRCPHCGEITCVFTQSQGIAQPTFYINLRHYECVSCSWRFADGLRIEYYSNDDLLKPKEQTRDRSDVEGNFAIGDIPF